jgi:hypothetical protein
MILRPRLRLAGMVALAAGVLALMPGCAPKEDMSVSIVTSCDVSLLASDPVETTARLFFETAGELSERAAGLEQQLTQICNDINAASGDDPGAELRVACGKIGTRVAEAKALIPEAEPGGIIPVWVSVRYDETCRLNTVAEAECLSSCSTAPCDPLACPPTELSGNCGGDCTGTCSVRSEGAACVGECAGACATPPEGRMCTSAECSGACTAGEWTGRCDAGCSAGFYGKCGGACSGKCAEDAEQASKGLGADVNGPCARICVGQCSGNASGSCNAACAGSYSGGACFLGGPASRCLGTCGSPTASCLTACTGRCTVPVTDEPCAGHCTGTCSVPFTEPRCSGALTCEANDQCRRVCAVRAALATTCEPPVAAEVRLVGEVAGLYQAIRTHLPQFAAISREAALVNEQSFRIARVTLADYQALGNTRDRVRVCVSEGARKVEEARTSLARTVSAANVINGISL